MDLGLKRNIYLNTPSMYNSMTESLINLVRIVTILVVLGYATYTDVKTRKVRDAVWFFPILIGLLTFVYEAYKFDATETVVTTLLSLILVGGVAFVLFRLRIFYGADYKSFVVIALLFPTTPQVTEAFPIYDTSFAFDESEILDSDSIKQLLTSVNRYVAIEMFGFSVFVNSSLLSVVYFFTNGYHNIVSSNFDIRRPLRSLCARKIEASNITEVHAQYVRETSSKNPIHRGIQFIQNGLRGVSSSFFKDYIEWHRNKKFNSPDETLDDIDELKLEEFRDDKEDWVITNVERDKEIAMEVIRKEEIWVTPSIPYILIINLGVISSLVVGNIWYSIMML